MHYVRIIDENGFFVEDCFVEELTEHTIITPCPDGLFKPKWNGSEWIEGATQSEINELQETSSYRMHVRTLLDIPTYDGNPSTGHPSIVFSRNGWNGYKYWLADTPYPTETRENPSVFVSNDGVNWFVPMGAPNPVVPRSEILSDGYDYGSDTNLIMLPNNKLALYYRLCGLHETIFRMVSSDGINWGEKTSCVHKEHTNTKLISPSVVINGDDYIMYSIDASSTPHKIQMRISSDGINWGEPTDTINPISTPWHLEVNLHEGIYRMLVSEYPVWDMHYLKSSDGINWVKPYDHPVIHRSGEDYDINGHYKATMVPVVGQPLLFDIWVTCLSSFSQVNVYDPSCVWRTQYLKDVNLEYGTQLAIFNNLVFKEDDLRLWVGAGEMHSDRQMISQHNTTPCYLFPAEVYSRATGSVVFPDFWKRVKMSVLWLNRGAGAGNVRLKTERYGVLPGDSFTSPSFVQIEGSTVPAAAQYTLNKTTFDYIYNSQVHKNTLTGFYVERQGSETSDTLLEDIGFLGVLFEGIK